MNAGKLGLAAGLALALGLVFFTARWVAARTASETTAASSLPDPVELDTLSRYLRPVPLPEILEPSPMPSSPLDTGRGTSLLDDRSFASPTRPRAPAAPRWRASAILITDSRRVAVINGALVGVGDAVPGGGRVAAIESDHVILEEPGGRRRALTVGGR